MDVVEALRADWHTDPFEFVEKDGYYYGRGTQDMKDSDAVIVATLLRLHKEGYKPRRDLILALTADEEGTHEDGEDEPLAKVQAVVLGAALLSREHTELTGQT